MVRNDIAACDLLAQELMGLPDPRCACLLHYLIGSRELLTGDPGKALAELMAGFEIAEALPSSLITYELARSIALAYVSLSDRKSALLWHDRHLDLVTRDQFDSGIGAANSNIGTIYFDAGDYAQALEYYRKAIPYHEKAGNLRNLAATTGNIGKALNLAGQRSEALPMLKRAFELHMELDNLTGAASVANSISDIMWDEQQSDEAEFWARRSYDLAEAQSDKRVRGMSRQRVAVVHMHRGEWDEAIAMLDSLSDLEPLDAFVHGDALMLRAQIMMSLERNDEAKSLFEQVLEWRTEHGLLHGQMRAHAYLRDLAKKVGDFEGYVLHSEAHQKLTEQIKGAETARKIAVMDAQAALEQSKAERERERAILYATLPQEIADRLIRGENVSGDEHHHAAVLFADIVGFTSHSSSMSASETSALLDTIFAAFDAICDAHGMLKIKTIGDSYMAVAFGEAASTEQRAASVALEMMTSEFTWPREASPEGMLADSREAVRFRIGLHSGPVVAGVIGTQRLQYDVWGDTVNTASRMESTGEPGRIQCSETFATALGNGESEMGNATAARVIPSASEEPWNYRTVERGTMDIKGKGLMTTFWLEGATP